VRDQATEEECQEDPRPVGALVLGPEREHRQFQPRAVRIGQRNVVQVYNIVLKDEEALNIDTYMTDKAAEKGELCEKVLSFAKSDV
jgi:hypothetical protein